MPKPKKVILFLVEGSSDETAIVGPFKKVFGNSCTVDGYPICADVTTTPLFLSSTPIKWTGNIRDTVRGIVTDRIASYHEYRWGDLAGIVQIVDLDGAFIPDEAVRMNRQALTISYADDHIDTKDPLWVHKRNREKSKQIRELLRINELKYRRRSVPYRVFFMSRNLEHALYGNSGDVSDVDKEDCASEFYERYYNNPKEFIQFLQNPVISLNLNYKDAWDHVKQGVNSLRRGSNLGTLLAWDMLTMHEA